jgi:hypothetical protein
MAALQKDSQTKTASNAAQKRSSNCLLAKSSVDSVGCPETSQTCPIPDGSGQTASHPGAMQYLQ